MRSVRYMRNWSVDGTSLIVCGCASKVVCAWFWVLNGEWLKKIPTPNCASVCVIHESACVVYASSMRNYVQDSCRPSVLMHWNWFETAHFHVCPLMPHLIISRMNRARMNSACITFISLTSVERSQSVHVWTCCVRDSCVKRASNVQGILHSIC